MTNPILLRGISKRYKVYRARSDRAKELLSFGRSRRSRDFWALKDINLEVNKGVTLGLVGRNGAGKSTLLKIISGVLQPSSGTVDVRGRLVALLQLGAGFNPEFTGRENVMMNGLILGIERKEMIRRFDEIAEFADIGEFMEQPVRTYSSGMRARLGFAVAVNVEPEILIVDEILSVGDTAFKQRSIQKMRNLRDSGGTTTLFVSHNEGQIKNFCTEAALLHKGELLAHGGASETVDFYQALLAGEEPAAATSGSPSGLSAGGRVRDSDDPEYAEKEGAEEHLPGEDPPRFKEDPSLDRGPAGFRRGTGEARISSLEVIDKRGRRTQEVSSGTAMTVRAHLEFVEEVKASALQITLRNKTGLDVFSTSTALERTPIGKRAAGERMIVDFAFEASVQPGTYSITVGIAPARDHRAYFDWIDVAAAFRVSKPENRPAVPGLVHLPTSVEFRSPQPAVAGTKPRTEDAVDSDGLSPDA